jgi:hypothetical protein
MLNSSTMNHLLVHAQCNRANRYLFHDRLIDIELAAKKQKVVFFLERYGCLLSTGCYLGFIEGDSKIEFQRRIFACII